MKKSKETVDWIFSEASPEEHKKYVEKTAEQDRIYCKKKRQREQLRMFFKLLSNIILWVCAVGGFVLALIQFFQN